MTFKPRNKTEQYLWDNLHSSYPTSINVGPGGLRDRPWNAYQRMLKEGVIENTPESQKEYGKHELEFRLKGATS